MSKVLEKTSPLATVPAFTRDQIELITRTICKGASPDELQLFLGLCKRTGLDPFARQVFAIRRYDSREKREVMTVQVSIDGLRLIASRTGEYHGAEGPLWCGMDHVWLDAWLADEPPAACKMGVWRANCRTPFWAVSRFSEYAQSDRDGNLLGLWRKMPANMLAKTCEALALRRAFPQELSGIYSVDEMDHANGAEPVRAAQDPSKPWTTFAGMVNEFSKLHARLGTEHDHVYRETLRKYGTEHSNHFKDANKALAAYAELLTRVQEIEEAAAEDAVIPEEAS